MRYFLIVGEASADLHASRLITAIQGLDAEAEFAFMGGDLMAEATSTEPVVHYREVAYMGVLPVLRHLGDIRRAAQRVQSALMDFAPDVVIPIDFAGFNARYILPFVKEHLGCPIIYYIAPKLWAWKSWRIKRLRQHTDLLLCILPFEATYFADRGVRSLYVGNPSVDATRGIHCTTAPLGDQVALLAGSRKQELASNLPVMLWATQHLAEDYHIVLAGAPGLTADDYTPYLKDYPYVELLFGDTYRIISGSMLALVTSGTATLETALIGTPQIVLYRMGGQWLARWIFDHLFGVKYISLVNLILGRLAVPELIGAEAGAQRIRGLVNELLGDTPMRTAQLIAIEELRQRLGDTHADEQAAKAILDYMRQHTSTTQSPS